MENLDSILAKAKAASYKLAALNTNEKNNILKEISDVLVLNKDKIICANAKDLENAKLNNISASFLDRLKLDDKRIDMLAYSIIDLVKLDDPIGKVISKFTQNDGLNITKISVPFGVICAIYEARPNVTVDISMMCIKCSNACVLRGGKEAYNTNVALVDLMKSVLKKYGLEDSIYLISDLRHEVVDMLITKKDYIDLVIPRGGKSLINNVVSKASVPVIETGAGNCHIYVEKTANFDMAINVIINAKVQRPSVCNAVESILVDEDISKAFLPKLKDSLDKYGVEIRGCEKSAEIIDCKKASDDDYYQEYNDLVLSLKIVKDYKEAINWINKYSTHHSDAIITEDSTIVDVFFKGVDSACVYHNASTRFTDGGCFGYGAEVGISTQKLHARGPMGLNELTTYKYIIEGKGQVRK
ncbi:MAG: glutamate-5-semialdehyde dehydrogenase [Bacilli bacterium]|nr:glutamate-5-semialdehyde dehydrogenase [Bacilli bacterium]